MVSKSTYTFVALMAVIAIAVGAMAYTVWNQDTGGSAFPPDRTIQSIGCPYRKVSNGA